MANVEWFRNKSWSASIAANFEAKLARARRKEQYLRIQSSSLASEFPDVAHGLLDRYFELPDQSDAAQAHVDRAKAFLAQARIDEALLAYERALFREAEFPRLKTQAYLELPFMVATRSLREWYVRARQLLDDHKTRLMFPVDHFRWNTSYALIATELAEDARPYAEAALVAAAADHSGFQYHPGVGLVPISLLDVTRQLQEIVER